MHRLLAVFAVLVFSPWAFAQPSADYQAVTVNGVELARSEQYVSAAGAALHGFDPVAYHLDGQATPGVPEIQAVYNDAVWLFASEAHRDAFLAEPARFAPAYEGHCAFAAARGVKAAGNPHYWHIEDGVLYVNINADVQEEFLGDAAGMIERGVVNWNEGSGALFRGGPVHERPASRPLRDVDGEVDPG